ncbi:MAG TPA: hypothetical protein VLE70_07050 [Anaerolineae bacterium]|nr:hypothetical protein [Anaerolineae bacterium]
MPCPYGAGAAYHGDMRVHPENQKAGEAAGRAVADLPVPEPGQQASGEAGTDDSSSHRHGRGGGNPGRAALAI